MDSEVQELKAEVYDLNKELRGLTGFLNEVGKTLELSELTLDNIMEAIKELTK